MQLSARNKIKGTVVSVTRGPVTSFVKLDIGNGNLIDASVTTEAADELGLAEGKPAMAIFKASSVMVGIE